MVYYPKGQRGLSHIILESLLVRVSDNVNYVGMKKMFIKQNIDFIVDDFVFYSAKIDLRPTTYLSFETIADMDEDGKINRYGWTRNNKSHLTAIIMREHKDWVFYFFQAGEIIQAIKDNPESMTRYRTQGTIKEFYNIPKDKFKHKTPIRIPVIGEPNVENFKFIHEYAKDYIAY